MCSSDLSVRERFQKWVWRHPRLTSVTAIAFVTVSLAYAVGSYQESHRVAELQVEVADLIRDGKQALEDGEVGVAEGRFLAAWMKVQTEPAMLDHLAGAAGWLDHSRRRAIQEQWSHRIPPREFDEQRDEAFVLSLLLDPAPAKPIPAAREAIRAALELTNVGDPGWTVERERLTLIEADLIAAESNAGLAFKHLDATSEFSSRQYHEQRAKLLNQLGEQQAAEQERQRVAKFPSNEVAEKFLRGIRRLRSREFDLARQDFERVLETQPEQFAARLFQAICFINQKRPGEAKVALTACIAQRPYCLWSYYYRGQTCIALGDCKSGGADLQRVLDMKPPE